MGSRPDGMDLEYRSLTADDERFDRHVRYAFRPEAGPHADDEEERRNLSELRARRGLVKGDDLVAICGYFDFSARIRGEFRRLGGVSAVATPPEYRRRGYVERLLRELAGEFRDEGIHFSALWPFAGLSALDYPDISVDVTFRVDDPLVEANAGTYALVVEGGSGECRRTDVEPAAELDVGTLAQLCVGYRSARELATLGGLTGSESAVAALDRAFPPEDTFLRDGF